MCRFDLLGQLDRANACESLETDTRLKREGGYVRRDGYQPTFGGHARAARGEPDRASADEYHHDSDIGSVMWRGRMVGTFLDLNHGMPSHDTFGRVFRWLDNVAFQERFGSWTQALCRASNGKWVEVDGKQLRSLQDGQHERGGIWMVSAWASE